MASKAIAVLAFSLSMMISSMLVRSLSSSYGITSTMSNGDAVSSLREAADSVLVLIYDPADVFACSSAIQQWQSAESRGTLRVFLIFSRQPSEVEARQLRTSRISPHSGLRTKLLARKPLSAEYLFVGGKLKRSTQAPAIGNKSPFFHLTSDTSVRLPKVSSPSYASDQIIN